MWRDDIASCAFQNHIFRIKLDASVYLPALFHYLIQSYQPKRYFFSHAKQTSNLNTINSRDVKRLPVAIPEMDEQKEMVALLEACDESIDGVKATLQVLQRLKQSLLQNLLTGKVRVSMEA